ncbi:MAG TPA: hypothetical protein VFG40_07660 [Dyella sp.]|jgi:hypothetical protein|nr:hypothetical protein [Dyella sp.]
MRHEFSNCLQQRPALLGFRDHVHNRDRRECGEIRGEGHMARKVLVSL